MTCEGLRNRFQLALDSGGATDLPPDLQEHLDSCPECRRFVRAMRAVDLSLKESPAASVPPHLLEEIRALPDRIQAPEFTLREIVARVVVVCIGAGLFLFVQPMLASGGGALLRISLLTLAFVALIVTSMAPVQRGTDGSVARGL